MFYRRNGLYYSIIMGEVACVNAVLWTCVRTSHFPPTVQSHNTSKKSLLVYKRNM